jgi:hypothetical protein
MSWGAVGQHHTTDHPTGTGGVLLGLQPRFHEAPTVLLAGESNSAAFLPPKKSLQHVALLALAPMPRYSQQPQFPACSGPAGHIAH